MDNFYFGYDALYDPFNYKKPSPPSPPSPTSSPFPGWAIALIIILILVVVGGGAFIGYKFLAKKKSQLQENVEKTSFLGAGEPNKNLLINEQEST